MTLLHIAVINSLAYVWVRLLLVYGADPCAQDEDGYTPAHYAVECNDIAMLKALTMILHCHTKTLSDSEIVNVHQRCLNALVVREKSGGLIVSMLTCLKQAIKCVEYLHQLHMEQIETQVSERIY
ncbi:unnamed protein product [Didymodactylos carnosus]|uniref:Uncharacterized protein n=1 Tax=Didymodactylos carnosus TaxID=1234261 RepID=A0A815NEQ3_9BILA|nr:unnamed protein product [Didymodactylos carnosus]CAF1436712.1 unnamed protein product [Didymodactylos carnosus]CAF4143063.1 unnamed protein product [Didymodactylos carnosus]CAF4314077.1 unnamed protein product [Didymodactylos carnosus]